MALKEHVYSILVVSASTKFNESIALLLLNNICYSTVDYAENINSAQQQLLKRGYDIIIVNSPLPDDFGIKFAIDVSRNNSSVVMLFVRTDLYPDVYGKVMDYGIFTLRKPTPPQMVSQALDWLKTTVERLRNMGKKTISLQEKMEEIKLVNHAKWALINSLGMTEADAHKYIEKQAMDRCVTRREIAENIIQTYK